MTRAGIPGDLPGTPGDPPGTPGNPLGSPGDPLGPRTFLADYLVGGLLGRGVCVFFVE